MLDLNGTVGSIQRMLRRLIPENVALSLELQPGLGCVEADVSQLEQVIVNLVVNGRDALPDGGEIVIRTGDVVVTEDEARADPRMSAGRFVRLVVEDDGVGMDKETRAQMFEPFFTTKEAGRGTGLGLSTVFGIVSRHGGVIRALSEPNEGCRFEVYLPHASCTSAEPSQPIWDPKTMGHGETILVVEDQPLVRSLARRILERGGYRVLEARSPGQALLLAEDPSISIDLLFTDVVMPVMSGPALARRILESRPSLKVVFASGYPDAATGQHRVLAPGVTLIAKPYAASALTGTIRAVLEGKRPGGLGEG